MQGMSETNHPSPRSDQPKRFPLRLALFGAVSVVSVAFGFLAFNVNDSRILVQRYGYYSIAITFAWALVAMSRVVPEWVRNWPPVESKGIIYFGRDHRGPHVGCIDDRALHLQSALR